MSDKERLMSFMDKLIPDDIEFGHVSMTFNDDGSASLFIENKKDESE